MGRIQKLLWGVFHTGRGGRGQWLEEHEGSSQGFVKGEGDSSFTCCWKRQGGDLIVSDGKETVPRGPWGVGK